MIKVINVVQDFNMGGIQSVLLSLLRAFQNDPEVNYSVVVLESARGSEFDRIAVEEQLNIVYLDCKMPKNKNPYIRKFFRDLSYNGRLYRYLRKQKPDIVHTHNTRMLALIRKCIKWTRKKYVWFHTLHSDPYAVHEGHIPKIQQVVNEYGVHPVCLNETQFCRAQERYGLKSCDYIYNMVNLKKFHNILQNKQGCRKNLEIPNNAYVIGTVGRLDAVKNYRFLMRIFSIIAKRNPEAILVFTGDGEESELLHHDAKQYGVDERVRFLGVQRNTPEIYPVFDIFVSTSLFESSSLVVLEAQVTGLPCVTSAACPKESVISDKVVRMGKDASDEEWVEQLLSPSDWSLQYAEEADYSEERVKDSLKNLYRNVFMKDKNK